jgi:hypothetical protein
MSEENVIAVPGFEFAKMIAWRKDVPEPDC